MSNITIIAGMTPVEGGTLGTLSFNMTAVQQQSLIDNGYTATKNYFLTNATS